jgi:hypothetical protein
MFALRWTFPNGMDNGPVTAGDFNNDGVDDLVVITAFSSMDVHMSACSDMLPAVPPRVHLIGPARSAKNQPVTFTALLDSPEAHGSVAFYSEDRAGDNLLGTAPVLLEQAALTLLFPDLGERKIYAIYMGEGRQARAMSSVIAHDVVDPSELPRRRAVRR